MVDIRRDLGRVGEVVEDQKADGDVALGQLIGHQQRRVGAVGMADDDDRIGMCLIGGDNLRHVVAPVLEGVGDGGNALGCQFLASVSMPVEKMLRPPRKT